MIKLQYILFFILILTGNCFLRAQESNPLHWFPCKDSTGKWCFRSVEGEHLKGLYFDSVTGFQIIDKATLVSSVMRGGKWGAINQAGDLIVPIEHEYILVYQHTPQIITVIKPDANGQGQEGMYNIRGDEINPFKYCHCAYVDEYTWRIDSGHIIHSPDKFVHLSRAGSEPQPLFKCRYNLSQNHFDIVSRTGKILIDSSMYSNIQKEQLFVYLNDEGIVGSTTASIRKLQVFSDDTDPDQPTSLRYAISSNQGVMLINAQGETIVPEGKYDQYMQPLNFPHTTLISVRQKNGWGVIDLDGNILMEPQFDNPPFIKGSLLEGVISGKTVFFDQWKKLNFGTYDSLVIASHATYRDGFIIRENGKYGLVDENGKLIIPPLWDQFIQVQDLYIGRSSAPGMPDVLYDHNGKVLIENTYESILPLNHPDLILLQGKRSKLYNISSGKYLSKKIKPVSNAGKYKYWTEYEGGVIKIFVKNSGWKIIDMLGNTLVKPTCKTCQTVEPIIQDDKFIGAVYTNHELTPKQHVLNIQGKEIARFSAEKIEYNPEDNRIYVYKPCDTTVIYSLEGKPLYTVPGSIHYLKDTQVYRVYQKNVGTRFYDEHFKPLFDETFERMHLKGSQNMMIMSSKDKFYFVDLGKKAITGVYEKVTQFQDLTIGTHGQLADIYGPNGALLFKDCENYNAFQTHLTFQKAGKLHWVSATGERYLVTNL